MENKVTQAEYARMCGMTRNTVTKWKKAGRIVMDGDLVDVAASDAWLERYRRDGLPKSRSAADGKIVCLPITDIAGHLAALDWQHTPDWSEAAQKKRATEAAACIGLQLVTSGAPYGDGNWGGFQLRNPDYVKAHGLDEFAIWAGYGYELNAIDVIDYCRVEAIADPDLVKRPDLLPALAQPHGPGSTQDEFTSPISAATAAQPPAGTKEKYHE